MMQIAWVCLFLICGLLACKQRAQSDLLAENGAGGQNIKDVMLAEFSTERKFPDGRSHLPPDVAGLWGAPIHTPGMQAVHAILLPSGKVLVINGTGNRDNVSARVFRNVDFSYLYDPKSPQSIQVIHQQGFREPNKIVFDPKGLIDMFCGGHVHLPNGNVLFVSGSEKYDKFGGNAVARIFDYKSETFGKNMPLRDGHWYPGVKALGDGRVAVLSGYASLLQPADAGKQEKARGDINTESDFIEVFDPFDGTWQSFDLRKAPLENGQLIGPYLGGRWDRYPRMALIPDGRLLITGEGTGKGNRDASNRNAVFMEFSPRGQPLKISLQGAPNAKVDRNGRVIRTTFYGSPAYDPLSKTGDLLVVGGQKGSNNLGEFINSDDDLKHATTDLAHYIVPKKKGEKLVVRRIQGAIDPRVPRSIKPEYGSNGNSSRNLWGRINHLSVLLPTQQILTVGGGNYGYRAPVFHPVLMTPKALSDSNGSGYNKQLMNPHALPRLYHMVALLLPDATVFVAGGNAHRAQIDEDEEDKEDVEADAQDGIEPGQIPLLNRLGTPISEAEPKTPPRRNLPDEVHYIEIFQPPYLFHRPDRRPKIIGIDKNVIGYDETFKIKIENVLGQPLAILAKLGSVTHAADVGQRLVPLDITKRRGQTLTVRTPKHGNLAPPAVYMLFVVDDWSPKTGSRVRIPSVAQMVRLGSR